MTNFWLSERSFWDRVMTQRTQVGLTIYGKNEVPWHAAVDYWLIICLSSSFLFLAYLNANQWSWVEGVTKKWNKNLNQHHNINDETFTERCVTNTVLLTNIRKLLTVFLLLHRAGVKLTTCNHITVNLFFCQSKKTR